MRILNMKQVRALDAYTIQHEPISSIDLMERASRAFVDWFTLRVGSSKRVGVACGTGNNGGDGLAIARMLHEWGYAVRVWIVPGSRRSDDFLANLERLPSGVERHEVKDADEVSFDDRDVLIDALFGSGLSRHLTGLYAEVIDRINNADALRIAVDIPSGLKADAPSGGSIVRADYTVSFQLPKLAFLLPSSFPFTGEWVIVDIGLSKKFIRESPTTFFFTGLKRVQRMMKVRGRFDHKGTFGHALLIAGSFGKVGAAVLASRAALRSGVGLLSVHVPKCGYDILQTAVPEAMVQVDAEEDIFTNPPKLDSYEAIGIGPGLGQDPRTVKALARTLEYFEKPMVLDADALNILGAHRHLMTLIPPGSILTPHLREFERLAGPSKSDFERLEMLRQLAVSLKAVLVLKGAYSAVATPEGEIHFNSTGNPGMATGGTGDVLTGLLTGLLAQKYSPVEAAIAGVFLHGSAGDLGAVTYGMESLTASDLVENLPAAFMKAFRR